MADTMNYDGCGIVSFFHCGKCIEEWKNGPPTGQSPAEFAMLSVGYTEQGVQVWCPRHGMNVVHFAVPEGQKFVQVPEKETH